MRVGRGDRAEVVRVVDDRHEEVGRRDDRLALVELLHGGVVGRFDADEEIRRAYAGRAGCEMISRSSAGAILQPQPPPCDELGEAKGRGGIRERSWRSSRVGAGSRRDAAATAHSSRQAFAALHGRGRCADRTPRHKPLCLKPFLGCPCRRSMRGSAYRSGRESCLPRERARPDAKATTGRRHWRNRRLKPTDIAQSRLFPQGRRLPVGVSGPHPRPRIHPPDRRRAATATRTSSTGNRTSSPASSGAPAIVRASPRAAAAASRKAATPEGQARAGRDLPAEARRRRLQGRHPRRACRARREAQRQAHRARRRGTRVAHGGARPRAARLRMRGVRRRRAGRRHDAHADSQVPPARDR